MVLHSIEESRRLIFIPNDLGPFQVYNRFASVMVKPFSQICLSQVCLDQVCPSLDCFIQDCPSKNMHPFQK